MRTATAAVTSSASGPVGIPAIDPEPPTIGEPHVEVDRDPVVGPGPERPPGAESKREPLERAELVGAEVDEIGGGGVGERAQRVGQGPVAAEREPTEGDGTDPAVPEADGDVVEAVELVERAGRLAARRQVEAAPAYVDPITVAEQDAQGGERRELDVGGAAAGGEAVGGHVLGDRWQRELERDRENGEDGEAP
jgi:hypothetical protein